MKYVSIARWRDLEDRHLYEPGEKYPYDGREVSDERITALAGTQNKAGFALIKAVGKKNAETPAEEPKAAEKPVETPENEPVNEQEEKPVKAQPKKTGRKTKKAE